MARYVVVPLDLKCQRGDRRFMSLFYANAKNPLSKVLRVKETILKFHTKGI